MIEISQVFIRHRNKFLLQLRDFEPDIDFPGHWGFFAGHRKADETFYETMRRELEEELKWFPKELKPLGSIKLNDSRLIYAYGCSLNGSIKQLDLQEGQEIGEFSEKEILTKNLYSHIRENKYPISPISFHVYNKFNKDLKNA